MIAIERTRFGLAALVVLALLAGAFSLPAVVAAKQSAGRAATATPPAMDVLWPQTVVADPTTLGFTTAGLDALDARLRRAVADGDTAGITYILIRHGQVAAFKSIGQQSP